MGFHEPSHTYDLDGKQVPISVTTFLKSVMVKDDDEFDADDIISRNLTKWRSNASSKYYSVVLDKTDEQAAASIKRMWQQTAQMGTKLHALLEDTCNGMAVSTADRIEYATELDQYEHFRHDFDWTPYRTELCVAATRRRRREVGAWRSSNARRPRRCMPASRAITRIWMGEG